VNLPPSRVEAGAVLLAPPPGAGDSPAAASGGTTPSASTSAPTSDRRLWLAELRLRVVTCWRWKAVGTPIGIAGFFWLYFGVMQRPLFGGPPQPMPLLAADHWIGVHGWAVLPYASLWLQVSLVPALMADRAALLAYARSALLLALAGLVVFWVWPTTVAPDPARWADAPLLAFLKSADGGGNAFPSLHVAFAVHSAGHLGMVLRSIGAPRLLRAVNVGWAVLIAWSALATQQHVLLDVLAGLLLGTAALWPVWRQRSPPVSAAGPAGTRPCAGHAPR